MSGPLLDAILRNPYADAPRLAFADTIAGREPERAEFIRLQVALALVRRGERPLPEDHERLIERERVLLGLHGERWAEPVRGLVESWGFGRGFVEQVTVEDGAFLRTAGDLYRRAPILYLTLLGDLRATAPALFASPHLAGIRALDLRGGSSPLGDAGAALLADSPYLTRLTWLDLSGNDIGEAGLEALAASVRLRRLRYLGFAGNRAPDPTPQVAASAISYPLRGQELQILHGRREWLERHYPGDPPPFDAAGAIGEGARWLTGNRTARFLGDSSHWGAVKVLLTDTHGLWGGRNVLVEGAGRAIVQQVRGGERRYALPLAAEEVRRLLLAFIRYDFLTIRIPHRATILPDEIRTAITLIHAAGMAEVVGRWANDPPDDRFAVLYAALVALEQRTRDLTPAYAGDYDPEYLPRLARPLP